MIPYIAANYHLWLSWSAGFVNILHRLKNYQFYDFLVFYIRVWSFNTFSYFIQVCFVIILGNGWLHTCIQKYSMSIFILSTKKQTLKSNSRCYRVQWTKTKLVKKSQAIQKCEPSKEGEIMCSRSKHTSHIIKSLCARFTCR